MNQQSQLYYEPCSCVGRELYVKGGCEGRPPWPNGLRDEDGYALCGFCGHIQLLPRADRNTTLSLCPDCKKWYKGYKRWPKYHFPCPNCE
jgi:hypothetical protein